MIYGKEFKKYLLRNCRRLNTSILRVNWLNSQIKKYKHSMYKKHLTNGKCKSLKKHKKTDSKYIN